uniref:Uncharacterized protein n=1 Tax=viral metagenome TaxID=1070528 RepID=A0A6M3LKN7_9ZZZZ
MAGLSPTQRTLAALREQGMNATVAEKWVSFHSDDNDHSRKKKKPTGIRVDFFGIIDVVGLTPETTLGVQCCAGSGYSAHWHKLTEENAKNTKDWLACPSRKLEIYAWRKVKLKRGGKAMRWSARIVEIVLTDNGFEAVTKVD